MDLATKEDLMSLHIDQKVEKSKLIIKEAIDRYGIENIAIAITGGKDSTMGLWLFKLVCEEMGLKLPCCMFIDEGDVFDEITEFVNHIKKLWSLNIRILKNSDVSSKVNGIGEEVQVASLNETNQKALQEMGFSEKSFPFVPDSTVCNHLMKTIPMREFIINDGIKALFIAIRWDEQAARKDEEYFSPRTNPDHTRVHPILHFSERDIWIATFKYDVPYCSLYKYGYRSLGARCATGKVSDIPAWMQDLENTPERVGRGQDKEQVMDQLRALGYM
ncbi:phosphoadenosine phosphosulfate reductase family protein [Desulforhabdus amnigena]|jgi:phosphoadenosine phosphosulfate reductase|uniref:Nodulation protein n=1 Tax=Desulforhabdus amnigena TaxID=40218 RepID=A0A9W6D548_9BACT|nr:phosphoadenosine phosphosulfate reductase family protein [Desulforhabdus amnigena]GLI33416.1 nodulation protein [Desulforhabdus amnigena]